MTYSDEVLGRAPLFEALDEDGTKALRAGIVDVKLARGDRLFDEGEDLKGYLHWSKIEHKGAYSGGRCLTIEDRDAVVLSQACSDCAADRA